MSSINGRRWETSLSIKGHGVETFDDDGQQGNGGYVCGRDHEFFPLLPPGIAGGITK